MVDGADWPGHRAQEHLSPGMIRYWHG